jgi:hypothetical protein
VSRTEVEPLPATAVALVLAALAVLAFFLVVTVTPLANNDIWLHLANGKWILEHGRVPTTDPYSFTAGGDRFYAHEWLAGVIFQGVDVLFGVTGLIWTKALLGGAAILLAAVAGRRLGARTFSILACSTLAIAIASARFVERPELFSYALTGVYLLVLVREQDKLPAERNGSPAGYVFASGLWELVPLQWLWVQLHGYFLSGLALAGLFLAGETALRIFDRGRVVTRRLVAGALALVAMALVGIANPNGLEIYRFPFTVVGTDVFMRTVFEWTPTFTTEPVRSLPMFLGFCLLVPLLAASCLDSPRLLARHRLWRGIGIAGLAASLTFHPRIAASLLPDGFAPKGALLAQSPGRVLLDLLGRPDFEPSLGALGSALAAVAVFGFVWLALAALLFFFRGKPAVAAISILVFLGFLLLRGAGAPGPWIALGVLGAALSYAIVRRSVRVWRAAALLFFLVLATRQNRNIVNFAIVSLPFLAAGMTRLADAMRSVPPEAEIPWNTLAARKRLALGLALVALLLAVSAARSGWAYAPGYRKRPGFGVDRRFPASAVEYVKERGLSGNVFNTYYNGAYLIHELYPATRVFVDSRMDVYGAERLERYYAILRDPGEAARGLGEGVDYALLDYTFPPGGEREKGVFAYLAQSADWALDYFDDEAVVFVRARASAPWIEEDRYRIANPALYRPGAVAAMDPDTRARYEREVDRAVATSPRSAVARLMKCELLAAAGRRAEALALVDAILADVPDHAYTAIVGGRLAKGAGDRQRALRYYRRAVRLVPSSDELRREMSGV